jgi:hypothetical protein
MPEPDPLRALAEAEQRRAAMCTNIVLRYASAFGVHDSEMELGDGMALLSWPLKPTA